MKGNLPSPLAGGFRTIEFGIEFLKYFNVYWKLIQSLTQFDPVLGWEEINKQSTYYPFCKEFLT